MKDYKKILEGVVDIISTTEKSDIGFANICAYIGENCPELAESEDEKIRREILEYLEERMVVERFTDTKVKKDWIDWIEKKGDKEQLYIRFGEIPTDEKSKIYRGEIEVGIENGVSVYPTFKTNEGNIVLGLNLPVTKTTLYTLQHLIEYDNRPCYLVNGNYVGKDTDGQPLINNVRIIEKIDNYRVKEKKQGEQKPTDKVEPKFKVGDWVTNGEYNWKVTAINFLYYTLQSQDGDTVDDTIANVNKYLHHWTIQDAKDGDVLSWNDSNCIVLFKSIHDEDTFNGYGFISHCTGKFESWEFYTGLKGAHPATKEQRELLFQKIKESGYEWEADAKKLTKISELLLGTIYTHDDGRTGIVVDVDESGNPTLLLALRNTLSEKVNNKGKNVGPTWYDAVGNYDALKNPNGDLYKGELTFEPGFHLPSKEELDRICKNWSQIKLRLVNLASAGKCDGLKTDDGMYDTWFWSSTQHTEPNTSYYFDAYDGYVDYYNDRNYFYNSRARGVAVL